MKSAVLFFQQCAVGFVHFIFRDCIERSRRLIEQEQMAIFIECPRHHQFLHFTAGKRNAVVRHILAKIGFFFLRQTCNFFPESGADECFSATVTIGLFQWGAAHIFCNRKRECKRVLKDRRDCFVILCRIQTAKGNAVDGDIPFRWLI